jgi:hypothetical protein
MFDYLRLLFFVRVVRPSKLGTISPNSKIAGDFQIGPELMIPGGGGANFPARFGKSFLPLRYIITKSDSGIRQFRMRLLKYTLFNILSIWKL